MVLSDTNIMNVKMYLNTLGITGTRQDINACIKRCMKTYKDVSFNYYDLLGDCIIALQDVYIMDTIEYEQRKLLAFRYLGLKFNKNKRLYADVYHSALLSSNFTNELNLFKHHLKARFQDLTVMQKVRKEVSLEQKKSILELDSNAKFTTFNNNRCLHVVKVPRDYTSLDFCNNSNEPIQESFYNTALDSLNDNDKFILECYFELNMTLEQISLVQGNSKSSIHRNLNRIINKLKN